MYVHGADPASRETCRFPPNGECSVCVCCIYLPSLPLSLSPSLPPSLPPSRLFLCLAEGNTDSGTPVHHSKLVLLLLQHPRMGDQGKVCLLVHLCVCLLVCLYVCVFVNLLVSYSQVSKSIKINPSQTLGMT